MNKLRLVASVMMMTLTSTAFAGTQVKYETHYTIKKSTQVEHLKISQPNMDRVQFENA